MSCFNGIDIFNIDTSTGTCASVQMLSNIFGGPIDALTSKGSLASAGNSNLITLAIGHFDLAILTIFALLYGYIVFHGVVASANEGKFGGREMGHWSYPLRAISGPAMLMPIKSGFCLLQFLLMSFVLYGVNLANYVWHATTADIYQGFVPTTPSLIKSVITQKIGIDYVYAAVANIMSQNGLGGAPVKKTSSISIWDAGKYATIAADELNKACASSYNVNDKITGETQWCQDAVKAMQKNKMPSYHTGLGQYGTGNTIYPNSAVFVGSSDENYDGQITLPGAITVPANIKTFANGSSGPSLLRLLTVGWQNSLNPSSGTKPFGPNPTNLICTDGNCSFKDAADSAEAWLIQQEQALKPAADAANTIPGTGDTCHYTCRNQSNAQLGNLQRSSICKPTTAGGPAVPFDQCTTEMASVCTLMGGSYTQKCVKETTTYSNTGVASTSYLAIPAVSKGSQWWLGSTVYMTLTQQMGDNITKLITAVDQMQPTVTGELLTFTPGPNDGIPTIHYAFNVHTPNRAFRQSAVNAYGTMTPDSLDGSESAPTDAHTNQWGIKSGSLVLTGTGSSTSSGNNNTSDMLFNFKWDKLVSCYAPLMQVDPTTKKAITPQACFHNVIYGNELPQTMSIGGTSSTQVDFTRTAYPNWLKPTLEKMPIQYQDPIKVLIMLNMTDKPGTSTPFIDNASFMQYLKNIISVLSYNHAYPGDALPDSSQKSVDSGQEQQPVSDLLNKVFGHLVGTSSFFGPTNNIFNEIYSIGNTDLSGDQTDCSSNDTACQQSKLKALTNATFNTMAQAQKVGLDLIGTVVNSLEETYDNVNHQLFKDRQIDVGIAGGVAAAAMAASSGGMFSGSAGSAIATVGQTGLQLTMAYQMFSIGKEMMYMPIVIVVLTTLFGAGISFAVILPLTPFFLFWAGQVAWILGVIEMMIAAPLLLLGLTTPGGHQHFGHMMPGIKMMIGVVLRPVLMVLGLLVGMVLTFVLIRFSSQAFQVVAEQILHFAGSTDNFNSAAAAQVTMTKGIIACILVFTFCSFMMMAFTKCFSTIYIIPEKVTQWIGGIADRAGQQELQQMSSGISGAAKDGAQAGGSSAEKGISASQKLTSDVGGSGGQIMSAGNSLGTAANKAGSSNSGSSSSSDDGLSTDSSGSGGGGEAAAAV